MLVAMWMEAALPAGFPGTLPRGLPGSLLTDFLARWLADFRRRGGQNRPSRRVEMHANYGPQTLGMLTKFWEPGQVKTRLGASIGRGRAAALHRLFVTHLCEQLANTGHQRVVCLAPADRIESFRCELDGSQMSGCWDLVPQGSGSLGDRMRQWFQQTLAEQPGAAVLIGADCPTLAGTDVIEQSFELLATHAVVLVPATDGGYVLIGLRGPWRSEHQRLFDEIPWSTEHVLAITRQRLQQTGLTTAELSPMADVDDQADLDRLLVELAPHDHNGLRGKIEAILDRSETDA